MANTVEPVDVNKSGGESSTATTRPELSPWLVDLPQEFRYDFGVDENEIRIGYNTDLSGLLGSWPRDYLTAAGAYWDWVNDQGGVGGRRVVPVVMDNRLDTTAHIENYRVMAGDGPQSVVMFGQSTGWDQNRAIASMLVADSLVALPRSWHLDWVTAEMGENIIETQTSYCLEAVNGVTFLSERFGPRLAIVSQPDDYGAEGAAGARLAAEALGLDVVYDGSAMVRLGSDLASVTAAIAAAEPDIVWATVNNSALIQLVVGAEALGFDGQWGGNSASYTSDILANEEVSHLFGQRYTHFSPTLMWGTADSTAMTSMEQQLRQRAPSAPVTDVYIEGWLQAMTAHQILGQAALDGDMTRRGVTAAAKKVEVDLGGLAPNRSWTGSANDHVARHSYAYALSPETYSGRSSVDQVEASTGFTLLNGPFVSATTGNIDFPSSCY